MHPQNERWNLLSTELNEAGCKNQYESFVVDPESFDSKLKEALRQCRGIRIGSPFGELVTRSFPHENAGMMSLGAADTLLEVDGKWWTYSAIFGAFHHVLCQYGDRLNVEASALIVGSGASARVAISSLIKIGFREFKITNQFLDQGLSLIADLKKSYFGVSFSFTPVNQLIMLPGTNSIMINTTPGGPENELIPELLYFNFLEPGGVVWDLNLTEETSFLINEARQIGTKVIQGFEIASWADVIWADWTFGEKLDRETYLSKLTNLYKKPSLAEQGPSGQSY
ncbi:MAG: hypothetical protein IPJ71_12285 [Bdellovibrionales bacterium]|nr:hypothetical protein [Bdellovibrionales bacterium]